MEQSPAISLAVAIALAATLHANPASAQQKWSEQTTAAAMGYCLARHPYIPRDPTDPYTADGFEILPSPGILGVVRRNYVHQRPGDPAQSPDAGQDQSCAQACGQLGLFYGPGIGQALTYRSPTGEIRADGVGEMAQLAMQDFDFYEKQPVIAGMLGRPRNYHDKVDVAVAQADLCCCKIDVAVKQPPTDHACVGFEQPLIIGSRYGAATGQNPGDQIFTENGIKVTVEKFLQSNGNTEFNEAMVDNVFVPGGATQSLRVNNISVQFDFTGLAFGAKRVSLRYLDFGGSENLAANGDTTLEGEITTLSGSSTGGVTATVTETGSGPGNRYGVVELQDGVKSLLIGGQEFWIDEVCAEP